MKQPPFPYALVGLAALMIYLALTESETTIRVLCGVAALFLGAAALYQSRPVRSPQEPVGDDEA